jgi:hypothetical protein
MMGNGNEVPHSLGITHMKVSISLFSIAILGVLAGPPAVAAEDVAPTRADTSAPPPVQTVSAPHPDKIPEVDPIALYGNEILFDVFRKGKKVGEQWMYFSRNPAGDLSVQVRFHLGVDVLFFRAYTYDYESSEIWRDNKVIALAARVDDNGKVSSTSARIEDGVFKIEGPKGPIFASSWVFPSNHWHRGQVESSVILNTLTGALAHVDIQRRGIEKVPMGEGATDAEKFTYTGDLHDTDVWYDVAGRWVKMAFKAKDKSIVEFICRKCAPTEG